MMIAQAICLSMMMYGGWCFSRELVRWAWAKTHSEFREFTFTSYTGHYWRLNGSGRWLVASKLTDCLQDLHQETAKGSKQKHLSIEEGV